MSSTKYSLPSPKIKNDNGLRGLPSITIADLVNAEAHYLATLKRVGTRSTLHQINPWHLAERQATPSVPLWNDVERWTNMSHIHIKFHDVRYITKNTEPEQFFYMVSLFPHSLFLFVFLTTLIRLDHIPDFRSSLFSQPNSLTQLIL
ncbi:MAG: hypothetical protein J3Q66DRAFT_373712 [Benniella sp.]|nr:MAG: hypothetical protein J3Q66DRAFT_373712 [Benniella sp.]